MGNEKNPAYDRSLHTQNHYLHGPFRARFHCTINQFQHYFDRKIEFPFGESIGIFATVPFWYPLQTRRKQYHPERFISVG